MTDSPPPTYRLTEEQMLLRDAVRTLADERVAPRAAEIDQTGEFPEDLRQLLAAQDILALPFPEEYGGLGGDLLTHLPRGRAAQPRLRDDRPDPRGPGAGVAAAPPRRHRRAAGPLGPEARVRASTSSPSP